MELRDDMESQCEEVASQRTVEAQNADIERLMDQKLEERMNASAQIAACIVSSPNFTFGNMPCKLATQRAPKLQRIATKEQNNKGPTKAVEDPTLAATARYLLSLDNLYEEHTTEWTRAHRRAVKAEEKARDLERQLDEAHNQAI
ncbi:hypothetical protein EJB05_28608, partial [Eragrostis curvula]